MSTTRVPALLSFANLQMAAEATRLNEVLAGTLTLEAALISGNNRSSAFTTSEATNFAKDWIVVAHEPNTDTGFSGTVFQFTGADDPARGLIRGQLVMSFRSTEFIDDAVRDNQSTNSMEVQKFGWAFGQIADMKKWVDGLYTSGTLTASRPFTVTGYSLGGHLATAFNLMFPSSVSSTYTFNGAGVGKMLNGVSINTTIAQFEQMRQQTADLSSLFSRSDVRAVYQDLRRSMINGSRPTEVQRQSVLALMPTPGTVPLPVSTTDPDVRLLYEAFTRIQTIQAEATRIGSPPLHSGGSAERPLVPVTVERVDSTDINYQLAVLVAARNTASTNTLVSVLGREAGPYTIANFYDLYGAIPPSAVTNSQLHYGTATPIFIEDQPLWRGNVIADAIAQSSAYVDVKLLVDRFSLNDFGDTHSLVLLVDSLAVQNLFVKLMPSVHVDMLNSILQSASHLKRDTGVGPDNQGKAEGDVLENVVNALSRIFMGPGATALTGKLEGGTWADIEDRNRLHGRLRDLATSPAFTNTIGRVILLPADSQSGLASAARTDFSAFLSLYALAPFALRLTTEAQALTVQPALASNWESLHTAWIADKNAEAAGQSAQTFSEKYLADRAAMLDWLSVRNTKNVSGVITGGASGRPISQPANYLDATSKTELTVGSTDQASQRAQYIFGTDDMADVIEGYGLADHLYGGAGNDVLSGQGGADWLEGQLGNDSLLGGSGADTLLGGTGSDSLSGGAGNDSLLGGVGADHYTFEPGWGHDNVDDSDGWGSLVVTDLGVIDGAGALVVGDKVWQTADKRVNYTLVSVDASRNDLYVTFSDRPDVITVRNWSDARRVGITLGTTPAPAPPVSRTYVGDFVKKLEGDRYSHVGGNFVSAGVLANAADIITGSSNADSLSGLGGNDGLAGLEGQDQIDGGAGADLLLGGAGRDTILGGDGSDFIFGAGTGDLTYPTSTQTLPHVAEGPEIARGFDWVAYHAGIDGNGIPTIMLKGARISPVSDDPGNLIDGGIGDDWISGGPGKDTVRGGADNDDIEGLGHDDILFGDAGSDTISGDGIALGGYPGTVAGVQHGNDVIDGGAGNDSLTGQGGSDQIYGGVGNDSLWGDDIDVRFTPYANHGSDYLYGGDGADEATGGGGDDTLIGGEGNDQLIADWNPAKLPGEHHGSDVLEGGNGADYLEGGGRDDTLLGGIGDDMLWGDAALAGLTSAHTGADYLDGGDGTDAIVGGGKSDTLYGASGNDSLFGDGAGTAADDQGDDLIDGGAGNDTLEGAGGADALSAGAGNDLLEGGDGNDTLVGGAGTDVMRGGDGDDTYLVFAGDSPLDASGGAETIDDQQGGNTVRFRGHSPDAMTITALANGQLQLLASTGDALLVVNGGGGSIDRYEFDSAVSYRSDQLIGRYSATSVIATALNGTQRAVGGRNDDNLTVTSSGARLSGGRGNDTLRGSGGNNTYLFEVGDGADTITDTSAKTDATGAAAPNRLVFGVGITAADLKLTNMGGPGGFRIQVGPDSGQSIILGAFDASVAAAPIPIDSLAFADGTNLTYAQLVALGFDGTSGDDFISGTALDDRLDGGLGNDTLSGGLGSDSYRWHQGAGSDQIADGGPAASGTDVLQIGGGATAADLVYVRSGDDLMVRARAEDSQVTVVGHYAGSGLERLAFDDGSFLTPGEIDARLTNELTENRDVYTGTAGNDFIGSRGGDDLIYGIGGDDMIDGGAGGDELHGGHGNDSLYGGLGDDQLYGEIANDLVDGGEGNDRLSGEDGNDTLVGGPGLDTLYGDGGQDRLVDGEILHGSGGSDTYAFTSWQAAKLYEGTWASPDVDVLSLPVSSNSGLGVGLGYNGNTYGYDDLVLTLHGSTIAVSEYFGAPGGNNTIEAIRFSDGVSWTAADILARAPANATTEGNDTAVRGFRWGDVIDARGGNDYMEGMAGDDRLLGGTGNDTVYGNAGADTVEGGSGADQLYGDFYDGSSSGDGADRIDGGPGMDRLWGGGGNDILLGGDGGDVIAGNDGLDTLTGGTGSDLLQGGAGDDTYLVDLDSGNDSIQDSGGADRLSLASGILASDLGLYRDGTDLVVTVRQTLSQIRVANHYASAASALERIEFADGSAWDAAALQARTTGGAANAMTGTAVNDSFVVDNTGDTITESAGGGVDTVSSSVSYTLPVNVENLTLTGHVGLSATGNESNNLLIGNVGSNRLDGRAGADTLQGGSGDDFYVVSPVDGDVVVEAADAGVDTVTADWDYRLPANVENLIGSGYYLRWTVLTGNELNNEITMAHTQRPSLLDGGAGADTMTGLAPFSTFFVDNPGDVVVGTQSHIASAIDWTLADGWLDLALLPGAKRGVGNMLANRLFGNGQGDTLLGLAGNDSFFGASWSEGRDRGLNVHGGQGIDTFIGGPGDDLYHAEWTETNRDAVIELANEGNDTVEIAGSSRAYAIADFAHIENLSLADQAGAASLSGDDSDNLLTGNSSNNVLEGGGGNDILVDDWYRGYLSGYGAEDTLLGGDGDDRIESWGGSDWLDGGNGNDTYDLRPDSVAHVSFGAGSGADKAYGMGTNPGLGPVVVLKANTKPSDLALSRDGKNLKIGVGTSADSLTWVDFFTEATSLARTGNFGYLELAESVQLTATQVTNRLLGGNTNLASDGDDALLGGSGNDSLNGMAGSDVLMADAGDDLLIGGAGDDDLRGGAGNDSYRLDPGHGADRIMDSSGAADVLVYGSGIDPTDVNVVSFDGGMVLSLADGGGSVFVSTGSLESVRFSNGSVWDSAYLTALAQTRTGTAGNDFIFGDDSDNIIRTLGGNDTAFGGAGNDLIDGGPGNDSMAGQAGDDQYIVDSAGDVVVEDVDSGLDGVTASVSYSLGANVETLSLSGSSGLGGTGNALNNVLSGNAANNTLNGAAGNDTIDGGAGADTMIGGSGDDSFLVDVSGDVVMEAANAGTDTVRASASWVMGSNVEHLILVGSGAIDGTGNAMANTITGNAAGNQIDGGAGSDTLIGGGGDDSYLVDIATDTVVEAVGEGMDLVRSGVTYTLSANVENLMLTGSAVIQGTGNALDNQLTGNTANNTLSGGAGQDTLDGGAGNDTLIGGAGDDRYLVNTSADVITENANEGLDIVSASATYTLSANVENLTLTGTGAISGTGNALANLIIGNAGANTLTGADGNDTLDGGSGNDTMAGGAGNDTYVVDASGDMVSELANAGVDIVRASVTYTLANNVEQLALVGSAAISGTGNALNNQLTGNAWANGLNGGAGADTMVGGAGNDSYTVDNVGDLVTEIAGEGIDTVSSSVNHALANHVESLSLTGNAALNGTGNALDNLLMGNTGHNTLSGGAGNDTLDGGAGNDTLLGGTGDDSYTVNVSTDVVTENASEGTDTVNSTVAWTLGNNVEHLTLTGSGAVNGAGNALDNRIIGNGAANTLSGAAGNDTLEGLGGNDTLVGGVGGDVYRFGVGQGVDTVSENDPTAGVIDAVQLQGGLTQTSVRFGRVGNNLEMLIRNSADKLVFQNWYLGNQYHVEEFRFSDGAVLTDLQAQAMVGAMAAFGGSGSSGLGNASSLRMTIPQIELAPNAMV